MRISELIGVRVLDAAGEPVGVVQDLRASRDGDQLRIVGLVVGGDGVLDGMAHGWGFAAGRARGPGILRRLARRPVERARLVPVADVASWGREHVRLTTTRSALSPLSGGSRP